MIFLEQMIKGSTSGNGLLGILKWHRQVIHEIKEVIAQLLQNKMQQLTLIEANDFYVFSYLDPHNGRKDITNRRSISILGADLDKFQVFWLLFCENFIVLVMIRMNHE